MDSLGLDSLSLSPAPHLNPVQRSAYQALGLGPLWLLKQTEDETKVSAGGLSSGLAICQLCLRCKERSQVVQTEFGQAIEGVAKEAPRYLLLGESPSKQSDQEGQAFAGDERKLLEQVLKAIGVPLSQVAFGYQIKCFSPNTSTSMGLESATACRSWLAADLAQSQFEVVLLLGELIADPKQSFDESVRIVKLPNIAALLGSSSAKLEAWKALREAKLSR
jgi:uracil-DNA glycosylase family 4